ncbi:5'-3' exonuclease H3TH domain-containing protein [Paenibacillus sp. FSL H8-0548]|uniref:5'-3' exonuclease n=1 Tax=Paenibacillus sp. FSL H8-0548 TaxID=1920422 RepID=UPI0015C31E39|nr:5'-3' exonuclease H3TH domain-containing protein [Paenibacillus sp. FSL H8-0548]
MSEQRLLLVDGMAILFRAYFATSFGGSIRKTSLGVPVNAVHGFVRYFMDAINTFNPTHVACCWDMGSTTFRTEQYVGYKSNRPAAPEDLIPQFDLVKDVVASFGVPNIGIVGYEADDCIGTLAAALKDQAQIFVVTGDHDMLQLVDERVSVAIMKKGIGNYMVYTPETLMEERQLTASQIIDIKGLMGDTADNYPGVKGIGEKTAHKLIQEHGTIEALLANLDAVSKTIRAKIEADLEMLHLSRDLATIRCDVPVSAALEGCCWAYDRDTVTEKFVELEFNSLLKLIG